VLLGIAGTLLLIDWVRPGGQPGIHPGFALALVVITGGILLVRRTASGDASGGTDQPMTDESVAAAAPSAPTTRERRARVKRERSPLGLYVLGLLLLLAVGVLTAVDVGTAADFLPRQYAGVALAILGLGLVVGAW
ncbi:MAG: hypothetical protein LC798_06585, partial [Chloroflexi bacterium]|nr:hypothetical protein [Chloroflexota bacterium]